MVKMLHDAGIKSEHAYMAGLASIVLSLGMWSASRKKTGDSKAQADRWGIFVGHWAPSFLAVGIALRLEEKNPLETLKKK